MFILSHIQKYIFIYGLLQGRYGNYLIQDLWITCKSRVCWSMVCSQLRMKVPRIEIWASPLLSFHFQVCVSFNSSYLWQRTPETLRHLIVWWDLLKCLDPPKKAKGLHELALYMLSYVLLKVFHAYKCAFQTARLLGAEIFVLCFFFLAFLLQPINVAFACPTLLHNLSLIQKIEIILNIYC